tara:strand:+ start:1013 stop:1201 length:189 start_codon:yes stop_codon:yes gene_type:complete
MSCIQTATDYEFSKIMTAIKYGDDYTYQEIMLRWAKRSSVHDLAKSIKSLPSFISQPKDTIE